MSAVQAAIQWATRHPAEIAWLAENMDSNSFARSLAGDLDRNGFLTPNQLAAVQRGLQREAAAVSAPSVTVAEIERRFDSARENLIKRPAMRLDAFVFKAAGETSRNPGAIYVTDEDSGVYLGKVMGGKFLKSSDCTSEQQSRIVAAASNPAEAAEAYGRRTGNCSMCGRELTAEESIARFMGPVCAEKWGMA